VEGFNQISGIHCPMPAGAFYAFPNVTGLLGCRFQGKVLSTPFDLANFFLNEAKVACVPGEPFGTNAHLRFSYTGPLQFIEEGLHHLAQAIAQLD
jgi:aspartate aminotransferase